MMRKGNEIKWNSEAHNSFNQINKALTEAHVFISLEYSKEFLIFSFASEDTIVGVLLQKNNEGHEHPIAFMSRSLQGSELKYRNMEKQVYALVKSPKQF